MIDPFVGVLMVLAVARTTRLVAADDITAALRERATGWRKKLVNCSWCVSIWVSFLVVPTALLWGTTWWWKCGAMILGASYITGLISRFEQARPKAVRLEVFAVAPFSHQKLPDVDYGTPTAETSPADSSQDE